MEDTTGTGGATVATPEAVIEQPTNPAPVERSVIWLTSRTTFENGASFCAFRRYVETHAGTFGYGFQRKALSVPLVTGTYIHKAPELILKWILETRQRTGTQPAFAPDEVIRWAIEETIAAYRKVIDKRGFFTILKDAPEGNERLAYLITEQEWLLEGLVWAWAVGRLPAILAEYQIVSVETEEEYVAACTCGLGNGLGTINDHELRGCGGIGVLSRPDVLAARWSDGAYAYFELKSASVARKKWADSWERKQQFMLGILGAERRLGVEITHAYVEGLVKGQRKSDNWNDPNGQKIQQSCLVHSYFSPGRPPESIAQWRPNFKYMTYEGVEFTAKKTEGYTKVPIWSIPAEVGWPGKPAEMTVAEYWVKVLHNEYPSHLQKCLTTVGPIPKQRHMIEKALRSLVCEETMWQDRCWKIYEYSAANGVGWGNDQFMEFVETVVPRSWNCDPYGPEHPCPIQTVCHAVTDDWRDPIASGLMVFRTPHHAQEAAQMAARGLKPEFGLGEDQEEVEDDGD